jgi:hypothetical protein
MRGRTRVLLAALIAACALSAAVGTANARRFALSEQRIRAAWETLTPFVFTSESRRVRCPITLEGSFHSRTLSKVSGQLVGYITSAVLKRPCQAGEVWLQNGTERFPDGRTPSTLPWHVRYDSFAGTLPIIERIRIQVIGVGALGRITETFITIGCLYLTEVMNPLYFDLNVEAGLVTGIAADPFPTVPVHMTLEGICPATKFEGLPVPFTRQGTTTKITVALVQ